MGWVASSPILTGGIVTAGVAGLAAWRGPEVAAVLTRRAALDVLDGDPMSRMSTLSAALAGQVPVLTLLGLIAAAGVMVQTGPVFAPAALRPDSRAGMAASLRGAFSPAGLSVRALTLLGVLLTGSIIIAGVLPGAVALCAGDADRLAAALADASKRLAWWAAGAMVACGIIDLLRRRHRLHRALFRTREEAARDRREEEGGAGRETSRHRVRERSPMTLHEEVGSAVLVITGSNAAAALAYTPGESAPRILAAGRGWRALAISRAADDKSVKTAHDHDLAEELHRAGEGAYIPSTTYQRVAALLDADGSG